MKATSVNQKLCLAVLGTLLAILPASGASAIVICDWMSVTMIAQYPRLGRIGARVRFPNGVQKVWMLCSTEPLAPPDENVISPADCDNVLSTLYQAVSRGSEIRFRFLDNVPATGGGVATTCEDIAQWDIAVADYLYLMEIQ